MTFLHFELKKGLIGWLDIHNVLSVTAIPFHFMITYSGLIFFLTTYMILSVNIGITETQKDKYFNEVFPRTVEVEKSDTYQPLASLSDMYAKAINIGRKIL